MDKYYEERRIDHDLQSACEYAITNKNGFELEDVAYVLAACMGENDGPSYHWLIAMKDHTYAYVTGSCDYTGWDCQAGGEAEIHPTLISAIAAIPLKEDYDDRLLRRSIADQLQGILAHGEALSS